MDKYPIGYQVFITEFAVDIDEEKYVLVFWEAAAESYEVCIELLSNLEDRAFQFSEESLFVVDAGK